MPAIQVDFGETVNSRQSKGAKSQCSSSPVTATHCHPNPRRVCATPQAGGIQEPSDYCPCSPSCEQTTQIQQYWGALFLFPLPLLWDERSFIKGFRLISLPSGHRRLLPSHRALDTHRVFCPGLKRTLFAEQSEQHVKRRRGKKKRRDL